MDDVQNLILEEVRSLGRKLDQQGNKLDQHIIDESAEFRSIRSDIAQIRLETSLNKQKIGMFSAAISAIVAGLWAAFSAWFGK